MRAAPPAANSAPSASWCDPSAPRHERTRLGVAAVALLGLLTFPFHAALAREVVDSAGRHVQVPDRIERVMSAGPPASVLVYVLAPQKLIGWNRKPNAAELPYLAPTVRDLPEVGRLTGRGGTASLEAVMAAKPDVIIDFGSVNATYISLADRVQSQTGIPYVLIDGRFNNTAEALRLLGSILGLDERAGQLATRAQAILDAVDHVVATVPEGQRPRVYLAHRGGLETGNSGSINTEIIERAGGRNVVDAGGARGGIVDVSLEQVLKWAPDTIITTDAAFPAIVKADTAWAAVDAVKRGRIFVSPNLPYGWIDTPPSLNRLLGLEWLAGLFFPDRYKVEIRAETKAFYQLFYQVDLTDAQLDRLLAGAH
jgi:iron complex transport system substrate-binding protein